MHLAQFRHDAFGVKRHLTRDVFGQDCHQQVFERDGFPYTAFNSTHVTSSCWGAFPAKRVRSIRMLFNSAAGVSITPECSMVISRSSPYSCCALFSASTTPSVKTASQSPGCSVTVPDSKGA